MPKPFSDTAGSALNLHQSLFDNDGNNIFWEENSSDDLHLSELARHYIAGILAYAPEFMLVTNPTVNSYKRLVPSADAPRYATWGRRNRSALVRIPTYKPGKSLSTRLELRLPDPTCNPYLAFAATLAAGLKGIEDELCLPEEFTLDVHTPDAELAAAGYEKLPSSLGEAIKRFEGSELMRETLGDHIFEYLLESKRAEWNEFNSIVTNWEREHYYAGF